MRLAFIGLIILCFAIPSYAQHTRIGSALSLVQEEDGDPAGRFRILKFPNSSLINNNDGSFSIDADLLSATLRCPNGKTGDYCYIYESSMEKLYVNNKLRWFIPDDLVTSRLLLEDGSLLLLENGSSLILE